MEITCRHGETVLLAPINPDLCRPVASYPSRDGVSVISSRTRIPLPPLTGIREAYMVFCHEGWHYEFRRDPDPGTIHLHATLRCRDCSPQTLAEDYALMNLRKRSSAADQSGPPRALPDIVFPPALAELKAHMTMTVYPDTKQPRETLTVTLFHDQGTLKAFLNDRDNGVSCCVTSDSWQGLWLAVEKALSDPATDWRSRKRSQ